MICRLYVNHVIHLKVIVLILTKIISIKSKGIKPVFDIVGVKDTENYIANGFVVHNTAADWSKKENKELKKVLAQVRTKHMLYILCFPLKIEKLERNYLESFVGYWCDIIGRGTGAVFIKDLNPSMDSWRIKDFSNVGSYNEFTNVSEIKEKLKKHPNFWQIIKFPRPPEKLYMRYLKLREKNVYDDENVLMHVTRQDIYNACLILAVKDILTHDPSLSVARLMKYIKSEYDISMPKSQIMNCVEDAKQLIMKVRETAMEDVALGEHVSTKTHTDQYLQDNVSNGT